VRTDLHRLVPDLRAAAEAIGRRLDDLAQRSVQAT